MSDLKARADRLVGFEFEPITTEYTERDVSLYALGVGAPADPLNQDELKFVYELSGKNFQALPTFPVVYTSSMINYILGGKIGEVEFNPMVLVHGEQSISLKSTIPTSGKVTARPRVKNVYDKGSGMLVLTETACFDSQGTEIARLESSMFIRGLGGFGGERGTSGEANIPPDRAPDAVVEQKTLPQQALIYRLSGDRNPLHADPMMAAIGSFDRPILHGLCTLGFASRAVLKRVAGNDPARFKSIQVRFAKHVFPGETLITEMWKTSETRVIFRSKVVERPELVLTQAAAEISPV